MTTDPPASATQPVIRFSRSIGLLRAIAMGSSITVGLGVFILVGMFIQRVGTQTPQAYVIATVLFVPLVLTYAERAAVTPGSGGIFALVRSGGATWRTYASGWLLLGGHVALIALLGWGAALYLNISLERLLQISIDMLWLAPAMVVVVALNDLIGTQGGWRLRTLVIYVSIALLLVIAIRSWFLPVTTPTNQPLAAAESIGLMRVIALMAASLWGINFVLDSRDELRRPTFTMLPALLVPLVLSGTVGAITAVTELRYFGPALDDMTPLATMAIYASIAGENLLEVVAVTMGFLISLTALDRAMVTMLRLIGTMVRDGFIPDRLLAISPRFGTPLVALRLFAVASALVAAFAPKLPLVGVVALTFLWTTALLNAPDTLGRTSRLPAKRRLKLPLHPLFPILATVISLFLSLTLPAEVILVGAGWALLGALYYVGYARREGLEVRRREAVVGEVATDQRKAVYTVLVGIANPETAPALIRGGAVLARAQKGRLLVLKVVVFPDQVPQHVQRQLAHQQLQDLQAIIQRAEVQDVPVEGLVRLAQRPVDGILSTAQEEQVNLIFLGWEGERVYSEFDLGPLLDLVVRTAACDVVILRGCLPDTIQHILVPTVDSPNSRAAIRLAQKLVNGKAGQVVALNLVQDAYTSEEVDQARKRLVEMLKSIDGGAPIDLRVVPAEDVTAGILHAAPDFDILLLGASRGGVLDQVIFGGLPVTVARSSPRPVVLVKHYEGAPRFWVRRAWEAISAPFPSLSQFERSEIYQQMRRVAWPRIDFFVMIGLSAMIATLGLVQSSPAVIIGAMLVAPLMSPILAMAMSIVQGDLRLLRLSARATLSGIALAIGISIAVTFTSPTPVNTSEIMARTQPNLLDLLVALASGAAGGYAAARKEVAAALPGVAIAAALVPPLCVSGYGTATGQLDIAGGSSLLFITNLIAIVFAAAVVFLLLGFRPSRARLRGQVRLKFLISMLALVLISIPLAVFSVNTVDQITRQQQIETVLNTEIAPEHAHVTNVVVERQGEGLVVYATIYALDTFPTDQVTALEERLTATLGAPVTLRATVLRAELLPDRESRVLP